MCGGLKGSVGVEVGFEVDFLGGGLAEEGVSGGAGECVKALRASGEEGEVPSVFFVDTADEGWGRSEDFDAGEV